MINLSNYEKGFVAACVMLEKFYTSLIAKLHRATLNKERQLYLTETERRILSSGNKLVDKLYANLKEIVGDVVINKQAE